MVTIAEVLVRQYGSCFSTLRETIEGCPDAEWRSSDNPRFIPSRLALHILETVDYYNGATREFTESPFGDSETLAPDALPSRENIFGYFEEVRGKLIKKVCSLGDEDLLAPETVFSDREEGYTLLDLYLYTLRHTQHHAGQLVEEMRRRGISGPRWR